MLVVGALRLHCKTCYNIICYNRIDAFFDMFSKFILTLVVVFN